MNCSDVLASYKLLIALFLVCVNTPVFSSSCHPQIDRKLQQYVIGYGSLIDEKSKKRTDKTAQENIPVLVRGYKRYWGVHGNAPGLNATFLSVKKDEKAFFNGVIYKLQQPEHIRKYDRREKVYCRREVSSVSIHTFGVMLSPKIQIWIYVPNEKKNEPASAEFPVVQSYVDIFVRGCIQIEKKYQLSHFAKQCILTTEQWPDDWVNDRIFPRRPTIYEPYAHKIDKLLKETLPEKFKNIR